MMMIPREYSSHAIYHTAKNDFLLPMASYSMTDFERIETLKGKHTDTLYH
jgi:hypothetical protein